MEVAFGGEKVDCNSDHQQHRRPKIHEFHPDILCHSFPTISLTLEIGF